MAPTLHPHVAVRPPHGWVGVDLHSHTMPRGLPAHEAATRIPAQGGLVYVPHRLDPSRHCLGEPSSADLVLAGLVHAVEARNGAGSDAHVPAAFGAADVELPDFGGPSDVLAALAQGRVVGHHFDGVRPWRATVVPSTRTPAPPAA